MRVQTAATCKINLPKSTGVELYQVHGSGRLFFFFFFFFWNYEHKKKSFPQLKRAGDCTGAHFSILDQTMNTWEMVGRSRVCYFRESASQQAQAGVAWTKATPGFQLPRSCSRSTSRDPQTLAESENSCQERRFYFLTWWKTTAFVVSIINHYRKWGGSLEKKKKENVHLSWADGFHAPELLTQLMLPANRLS